jgi:DNA-directed RNA polymerase subunit RPC12/RpoP
MANKFTCPSCGASLDYDGGDDPVVRCIYCGSNVAVPPEILSPRPAQAPAEGATGPRVVSKEEAAQLVRETLGMVSQQQRQVGRAVSWIIIAAVVGFLVLFAAVFVILMVMTGR